jgi:hypothetical protein
MDPDRTIISLFDEHQNPHVVVTYSPNEKRISGDEGAGGTGVKSEYHSYVLDLAKVLGARFDYDRSKSSELRLKGALGDAVQSLELYFGNTLNTIYLLTMKDGKEYYTAATLAALLDTNSYDFISKDDLDAKINERIIEKRKAEGKRALKKPIKVIDKNRKEYIGWVLNRNNETSGLINLRDLKKLYSEEN